MTSGQRLVRLGLLGLLALLGGAVGGCLIDLDIDISCGDGFVDRSAGETCDPEAETEVWALDLSCPDGRPPLLERGHCDEELCVLVDDVDPCSRCGDGRLDPGEFCEVGAPGAGGNRYDDDEWPRYCRPRCGVDVNVNLRVLCDAPCIAELCTHHDPSTVSLEPQPDEVTNADREALQCCIDVGEPCDPSGDLRCCGTCYQGTCVAE